MREYLERFAKRMEFLSVADSIVGRANKNQEIERAFSPGELDNVLLSVLVFIMETTLTEEQECTISAISNFLAEILPSYQKQVIYLDCDELARYLIKDILQNKGEIRNALIMDYANGMKNFSVRLVADKLDSRGQILYELTRQGFDFLFRTKEVDDELGFEIEAIRLRMLITKKNYKKATSQSRYILAMLIEKRNEIDQFEQQLRHDLFLVSGEQYDEIVRGVDTMLREEYELMREIERMLELAQTRLHEESKTGSAPDEKTLSAQRDIFVITGNVQRALEMQRALLIRCEDLRKLYISLLRDALLFHSVRRFDLEEQILGRMERLAFSGAADLSRLRARLLAPLFLPDIKRSLGLQLVYERQAKLRETQEDGGVMEDETDDSSEILERIRRQNEAHVRIISLLLQFSKDKDAFVFRDFWQSIRMHRYIAEMTEERLLFLDMLKLYAIREIDIEKWIAQMTPSLECMGEFDLNYCLTSYFGRDSSMLSIRRILIDKTEERISCEVGEDERIEIDNLLFEVERYEADGEGALQATN